MSALRTGTRRPTLFGAHRQHICWPPRAKSSHINLHASRDQRRASRSKHICRGRKRKAPVEAEVVESPQDKQASPDRGHKNGSTPENMEPSLQDSEVDSEAQEGISDDEDLGVYDEDVESAEDRYFLYEGDESQREMPAGEPTYLSQEEYEEMCDLPMPSEVTQQTLRHVVFLEGIGMHSGKPSRVRIMPAYAGEGRYFVMVPEGSIQEPEMPASLKEQLQPKVNEEEKSRRPFWGEDTLEEARLHQDPDEIKARSPDDIIVDAVLDNARVFPQDCIFLTLEQGRHKIYAAETLLAALEASGVDNCRIEVEMASQPDKEERDEAAQETGEPQVKLEGQEIPMSDGSALFWADMIKEVTIRPAPGREGEEPAPKSLYASNKIISVRDGESFITLMPSTSQRVTVGIDHTEDAPIIANQWASWSPSNTAQHHYRWLIAPARMYLPSAEEGFRRRAQGYFKGSLDPTVLAIADWTTWHELMHIRFTDEAVRWRLTEFLADLALLSSQGRGGVPRGHIIAYQASRALTLKFMRTVVKLCAEQQ